MHPPGARTMCPRVPGPRELTASHAICLPATSWGHRLDSYFGDESFGCKGDKLWTNPWIILLKSVDFHPNISTRMSVCTHQTYLKLCSRAESFSITSRGVSSKEVGVRLKLTNSTAYKERTHGFLQIRNYYGLLNELSTIQYSEAIHVRKIIMLTSNFFKRPCDTQRHIK